MAERCNFNANKEKRFLKQIIKGMKCAEKRRNLISKPSLTQKIVIENIRAYEATIKDNTHYKDTREIRAGVYHEVTAKKQKTMHKMWKCHKKKKKEQCYSFNKECRRCHSLYHFENYCLTKTHVRQQRNHSPKKVRKGSL